jgi:hypothetical protein
VEGDPAFSKNAEEAALACKQNGGLSHSIGHSTDKCIVIVSRATFRIVPGGAADGDEIIAIELPIDILEAVFRDIGMILQSAVGIADEKRKCL